MVVGRTNGLLRSSATSFHFFRSILYSSTAAAPMCNEEIGSAARSSGSGNGVSRGRNGGNGAAVGAIMFSNLRLLL